MLPTIAVGTTEEVLDTLRQTKLSELRAICDALPTRFSNALAAAAKLLEPKAQHVTLPGGTIKNEDDLKSWLTAAEEQIREEAQGRPGDCVGQASKSDEIGNVSIVQYWSISPSHSTRNSFRLLT